MQRAERALSLSVCLWMLHRAKYEEGALEVGPLLSPQTAPFQRVAGSTLKVREGETFRLETRPRTGGVRRPPPPAPNATTPGPGQAPARPGALCRGAGAGTVSAGAEP